MIKSYSQAIEFLTSAPSFIDKEEQITNLKLLLEKLGDPQKKVKAIHVAGTNGKGSVCAYFDRILLNSGYKVGLYTSPYLVDFCERIQINDNLIDKNDVIKYVDIIKKECEILNINMSQFAYITAMMFMYFADNSVDYAVIEVGLGGRFDPTVLCSPCLCAITSISLDHTAILGADLRLIANEKAGIIKKRVPVVSVEQERGAREEIEAVADFMQSQLHFAVPSDIQSSADGTKFTFQDKQYQTSMLGGYQAQNAAIAICGSKILGLDGDIVKNSIAQTVWKGRLQVVSRSPYVLVDGAHNPDAAEKLRQFVKGIAKDAILICAMAQDKDISGAVSCFSDIARRVLCVNINTPRGASNRFLLRCFNDYGIDGEVHDNVMDALGRAVEIWKRYCDDKTIIVICGSLYLAGEFLSYSEEEIENEIIKAKEAI